MDSVTETEGLEDEEEISYAEILASVSLNSEIIITISPEDLDRVKTGLKNFKAKQAIKIKTDGLVPPQETLIFEESPSKEFLGYIELTIILKQKGTVKIKKLALPDNNF